MLKPKAKLTFHPRPLILDSDKSFSEITGLFELKFILSSTQYYSVEKNNINMIFILDSLTKCQSSTKIGLPHGIS